MNETPERLAKLHLFITIAAAAVMTVVSIVRHVSLYRMSIWVSATIILFYVIGQILRIFVFDKIYRQLEEVRLAAEAEATAAAAAEAEAAEAAAMEEAAAAEAAAAAEEDGLLTDGPDSQDMEFSEALTDEDYEYQEA